MPTAASEALTLALAEACDDPLAATDPYGVDDGIMRMLVTRHAFAVLLIGHHHKTITVLKITHLD
nr:hypothetical protein [Streptomyces sp. SID8352]